MVFALAAAAARGEPAVDASGSAAEPAAIPPSVLNADAESRSRALLCLTEAVYYEAATEPRAGQEAVAQVVLNRVGRPSFPKSVCGVVYQGSQRRTGCQFTFTCDGSLTKRPIAGLWEAAQSVASAALNGYVDEQVGAATHYHAAWMTPYWSSTLTQVGRIGGHVFYRMPGSAGSSLFLTGRYGGAEPLESELGLQPLDRRAPAESATSGPPERGDGQFSVWGLGVATLSAHGGRIIVRQEAPATGGARSPAP